MFLTLLYLYLSKMITRIQEPLPGGKPFVEKKITPVRSERYNIYIWWFDKCHTNLSQSSDKEGGSDGRTKLSNGTVALLKNHTSVK